VFLGIVIVGLDLGESGRDPNLGVNDPTLVGDDLDVLELEIFHEDLEDDVDLPYPLLVDRYDPDDLPANALASVK
jgi:hypothetical protein